MFSLLFQFPVKEGGSSIFAGGYIECMKTPYLGPNGHIAIATNSVARAEAYLSRAGFAVDESTVRKNSVGKTTSVYLKQMIAGFAVHLLQKGN